MKDETTTATYAQMGLAALLPGMQFAVECIQRQVDEMRAQLASMQNGTPKRRSGKLEVTLQHVKRGPKPIEDPTASKHGWPADPAARSAEMKRRQAVARDKREGRKSPAFAKKMRRVAKDSWANMTARERKERVAKLTAARAAARAKRAKQPVASLAVAS